jgi:ribosomal protein S27AE
MDGKEAVMSICPECGFGSILPKDLTIPPNYVRCAKCNLAYVPEAESTVEFLKFIRDSITRQDQALMKIYESIERAEKIIEDIISNMESEKEAVKSCPKCGNMALYAYEDDPAGIVRCGKCGNIFPEAESKDLEFKNKINDRLEAIERKLDRLSKRLIGE